MKNVLIIPDYKTQFCENYIKACWRAGLNPTLSDTAVDPAFYDGLIVPGGADVDPSFYGEENTASIHTDPAFDRLELSIIDAFFKAGKPILGVCRGNQLLNVYFGGSLVQHIEGHSRPDGSKHGVRMAEGTRLAEKFPAELQVNSTHHQCIGRLGEDLDILAWSPEGIPEGFVHRTAPVFGVQWHPEKLMDDESAEFEGLYVYRLFAEMLA